MRRTIPHQLFLCFLLIGLFYSCKKELSTPAPNTLPDLPQAAQSTSALSYSSGCVEDEDLGSHYDSLPRPTILGARLVNNPYSVANMQQASLNLYGTTSGVTENKWYVRFKPSSPEQLGQLEELDIDLFDYPLDYGVVQEGDYYDDGVTPAEEIPWLYAVVNSNFSPPAGIPYELLQRLHVPSSDEIEAEAFRLTGNPVDDSTCTSATLTTTARQEPHAAPQKKKPGIYRAGDCPAGFQWDPIARECVPNAPQPASPSPTRQPSGTVRVFDNNFGNFVPVRNVRVVVKRFLKVERTFTDNQGRYFITKEFRKASIFIRTKGERASVRALRRARLWQMLFPVEVHFGKFKGSLRGLSHDVTRNEDALTAAARYWAAATAHNCVQEYYDFAAEQRIGVPPANTKILLTNWRIQGPRGATPMFAKRVWPDVPESFLGFYLTWASELSLMANVLKRQVDITLGYNMDRVHGSDALASSDELGETAFHELTHAAHYNRVGDAVYTDFVNAQIDNIATKNNPPYGTNDNSYKSNLIALGESWGYHMGHFLSDRKYGASSSDFRNQSFTYTNGEIWLFGNFQAFTGLNAHVNLLEDFDNHRTNDTDSWIPIGLYLDLVDNRNDQAFGRVNLDDNVVGYTNERFFNALDNDIHSLPAFRVRLLNENGNDQQVGVDNIFTFYNVF